MNPEFVFRLQKKLSDIKGGDKGLVKRWKSFVGKREVVLKSLEEKKDSILPEDQAEINKWMKDVDYMTNYVAGWTDKYEIMKKMGQRASGYDKFVEASNKAIVALQNIESIIESSQDKFDQKQEEDRKLFEEKQTKLESDIAETRAKLITNLAKFADSEVLRGMYDEMNTYLGEEHKLDSEYLGQLQERIHILKGSVGALEQEQQRKAYESFQPDVPSVTNVVYNPPVDPGMFEETFQGIILTPITELRDTPQRALKEYFASHNIGVLDYSKIDPEFFVKFVSLAHNPASTSGDYAALFQEYDSKFAKIKPAISFTQEKTGKRQPTVNGIFGLIKKKPVKRRVIKPPVQKRVKAEPKIKKGRTNKQPKRGIDIPETPVGEGIAQ